MIPNKRLQVFVSSTYLDLIDERQAAVQAILSSGHIPAGMELFSASDKSQLNVINKWIQQSDVFLLILGGRYGSIEPNSGKSYIQLEYEYAMALNIPIFSIVISDLCLEEKVKKHGTNVFEKDKQFELKEFKKLVQSKMIKFYNDIKDIKLAIYETLAEFELRSELVGWVPSNQKTDTSKMATEFARISSENAILQDRIIKLEDEKSSLTLNQKTLAYKNLDQRRRGFTQKAKIANYQIFLRTGEFNDGTLGEIFIDMPKIDSFSRSLLSCFASAISTGLQYGVPLQVFIENYIFIRFEPAGIVDHPNIKNAVSVIDYVFRLLGYEYLNRKDLVHVITTPEKDSKTEDKEMEE